MFRQYFSHITALWTWELPKLTSIITNAKLYIRWINRRIKHWYNFIGPQRWLTSRALASHAGGSNLSLTPSVVKTSWDSSTETKIRTARRECHKTFGWDHKTCHIRSLLRKGLLCSTKVGIKVTLCSIGDIYTYLKKIDGRGEGGGGLTKTKNKSIIWNYKKNP